MGGPVLAKDWEGNVRQTFYRLYITEDKKLSEVMEEMQELLGFRATRAYFISPQHPLGNDCGQGAPVQAEDLLLAPREERERS